MQTRKSDRMAERVLERHAHTLFAMSNLRPSDTGVNGAVIWVRSRCLVIAVLLVCDALAPALGCAAKRRATSQPEEFDLPFAPSRDPAGEDLSGFGVGAAVTPRLRMTGMPVNGDLACPVVTFAVWFATNGSAAELTALPEGPSVRL